MQQVIERDNLLDNVQQRGLQLRRELSQVLGGHPNVGDIRGRGLLAKAFQHEVDHLDGKLFIDLVDPALKPELKKAIKKLRKDWN